MSEQMSPITVLDDEACWELLARHQVGRLGFRLRDEVLVVPVNYRVHEGELVFRTADGSKFYAVEAASSVGFEIDEVTDDAARSVVVTGLVRELTDSAEAAEASEGLHPWVPTEKKRVMSIRPLEVTGRAFRLDR